MWNNFIHTGSAWHNASCWVQQHQGWIHDGFVWLGVHRSLSLQFCNFKLKGGWIDSAGDPDTKLIWAACNLFLYISPCGRDDPSNHLHRRRSILSCQGSWSWSIQRKAPTDGIPVYNWKSQLTFTYVDGPEHQAVFILHSWHPLSWWMPICSKGMVWRPPTHSSGGPQ